VAGPGVDYEHRIATDIADRTDHDLLPLSAGYTSIHNSAVDMLIDDGEAVHAFEMKRTSTDAYTLHWEPDDPRTDDLYALCGFCREYPRPTYAYWGVRFTQRQLLVGRLYVDEFPDTDDMLSTAVQIAPVVGTDVVSQTYADNLRVTKPSTDDWPSQTRGDDVQAVLDAIGYTL